MGIYIIFNININHKKRKIYISYTVLINKKEEEADAFKQQKKKEKH